MKLPGSDSYLLMLLMVPLAALFVFLVRWVLCKPIHDYSEYADRHPSLLEKMNDEYVSCFVIEHGNVLLFNYPPLSENIIYFCLLTALMIIMQALIMKPFFRLKKSVKAYFQSGI